MGMYFEGKRILIASCSQLRISSASLERVYFRSRQAHSKRG